MDNIELYEHITDLRERRGLTVRQLADRAGISRTTLYNLKQCRTDNLSPEVARKLARVLGCSAGELMRLDRKSIETCAEPTPTRIEVRVLGDFRVVAEEDGVSRISAKGLRLPREALMKEVKRYLFGTADASDELLQRVRAYAAALTEGPEKTSGA